MRRLWFLGLVALALLTASCANSVEANGHDATGSTQGTGTVAPVGVTSTPSSTTTTTTTSTVAPVGLSLRVEPQDGLAPIDAFMSSARQSLDMTMYELSDAAAEQILIADHQRGVQVRVLLDKKYSGGSVNQAAYSTLSAAGVSVAWTNSSEIFHQKTITVDHAVSAIMTGNLTSKYYATTRDFVVMDGQPADVAAIDSVFGSDWSGAAPSPGPPGSDLVWSPGSQQQLVALIDSASRSVVVENEEMDSAAMENALEGDARRGVAVTVIMTSDSEWDSAFSRLEAAGVHVVLYADRASTLYIHAKVIEVDSARAFVGSENFSTASLDYNRELGILTTAPGVIAPLGLILLSDASSGQHQGTAAPAPAPAAAPAPATTPGPPPPTATSSGCYPISNEGGCYKAGEFCRTSDHGKPGRAGDGEPIVCENRDGGWYWEST